MPGNRRIIASLALSQALNSACLPLTVIVGSLTVVELAGQDGRWAGVPSALGMAAGALAAFAAGRVLNVLGYRKVLPLAGISGMAGSLLAGLSFIRGWFWSFLAAFLLLGVAIGLIGLSRYAAAESSEPARRARSMGRVVLGSTAGAVLGPLLIDPFGRLAVFLGLPTLAGPWLAAFLLYGLACLNTVVLLHPEPKAIARLRATASAALASAGPPSRARGLSALLAMPGIFLPIASLVAAQVAMVLVMAITPLHMHSHHHAVGTISHVITAHFLGMYGLSVLSGWLADRLGRMRAVGLGGAVLAASCLLAPVAHSTAALMAALFLLGLGWSFCFIGASAALSEGLADAERGRVQGLAEALVSLSSAGASLGSGLLFASFGFASMTRVGLLASALPLLFFLGHLAAGAGVKKAGISPG